MKGYELAQDHEIIKRIPVAIVLRCKAVQGLTHDPKVVSLMSKTMLALSKLIDGVVLGYCYSDKICLLMNSRNADPWMGNNVQKIASSAAAWGTYEMTLAHWEMENSPELNGPPVFSAKVFGLPDISEAINFFVYHQLRCEHDSVVTAATANFPSHKLSDVLEGKSKQERIEALRAYGIDFESMPSAFRFGIGAYLIPKLQESKGPQQEISHRWFLDLDIPYFEDNQDFLRTIIRTGSDIFKPERDLK
jgi:tRNA(His) 5'-end guanylyltransferase